MPEPISRPISSVSPCNAHNAHRAAAAGAFRGSEWRSDAMSMISASSATAGAARRASPENVRDAARIEPGRIFHEEPQQPSAKGGVGEPGRHVSAHETHKIRGEILALEAGENAVELARTGA